MNAFSALLAAEQCDDTRGAASGRACAVGRRNVDRRVRSWHVPRLADSSADDRSEAERLVGNGSKEMTAVLRSDRGVG